MAYLSDFHCHSDISPDSRTDLVDLVQAAADKGVAELCVTEHWECGSPCMDWQLRKKPFDFTRYLERYEAAQRALGHRVKLRLGLEVGNWTQDPDHARKGLTVLGERQSAGEDPRVLDGHIGIGVGKASRRAGGKRENHGQCGKGEYKQSESSFHDDLLSLTAAAVKTAPAG